MTEARPAKQDVSRQDSLQGVRSGTLLAALAAAGVVVLGVVLWGSFRNQGGVGVPFSDPGPVHVHGLGINPADGALFIATHTGLFRVARDTRKALRVTDSYQDTMGFTVVGPNRFLGSGHPDLTEMREKGLPSRLGLIESPDAGESWGNVALLGEADFHVLRSAGARVYGYDASNDRLLASDDEGRGWRELDKPGQLVDIAVDPRTPGRLLATAVGGGDDGTFESRDNGKTWTRLTDVVGLLAWRAPDRLYLIDGAGRVYLSRDGGRRLAARGEIGGQPAALLGVVEDELYVALHDGTIKHSVDGGITWTVRSRP